MLVRLKKNRITYTLLVGLKNGTATLETSLAVSQKARHAVNI